MNSICPGDLVRIKRDFVKHLPVSINDKCWGSPMLVLSVSPGRDECFKDSVQIAKYNESSKRLIFLMLSTGRNVLIIEDYLEIVAKGVNNASLD